MKLISSSTDLKKEISKITKSSDFIAIDTEFVREKTYYSTLGLVQIGYNDEAFAIDPIETNIDLSPLKKLLANKKIRKVFHAAGQDLEIFHNIFGELPKNVFDSQIAAKLLGFGEAISYGKLVEHYEEEVLDKSARYTDWTKRPLDEKQLSYALDDVIYLKDIYLKMVIDLENKERIKWAEEESEKLLDESLYAIDPDECWQRMKIKSKNSKYLKILKCLCRWREITAQRINKPRGWILKDDAIQEIASLKPKKTSDLKGLRFFRFDEKTASELLGVVDFAINEEELPTIENKKKIPEGINAVVGILRILLKSQSEKHDIAPSVIASADDLKYIALGHYKKSNAMKGWRYDVFGKFAERLRKGEIAATVEGNEVILIEPTYE